ncbi:MAG: hypothetical protein IPN11_05565 [Opitutaceae bacterium]|nr:hypothetical protein [Opitutaceae bacterium]
MRIPIPTLCMAAALILAGETALVAQQSDLVSTQKRAAVVELADQLVSPRVLAEMPATLVVPFNPTGFDQPDPEEVKAQQAAAAAAAAAGTPVRPLGDRGVLATLADKLSPSGTAIIGGEPILLFGSRRLKIGDRLTVTYEGADYNLDITAITRTTFTLRLNREEITRPIKPGKKS